MKMLIEVKFAHTENSDDGYGNWHEYESLAYFDDVNMAWDFIQERVILYHTKYEDYSINPLVLNPSFRINPSYHEEFALKNFQQTEQAKKEHEKKVALEAITVGWKCSLCSMTFNNDKDIRNRKYRHDKFHENALTDKRNTTHGKPEWLRLVKKKNLILNKDKVTVEGDVNDS